jgi:hypothetical protein
MCQAYRDGATIEAGAVRARHNRLHVNAPKLCRFAQSYIIGGNYVGESPWRRAARTRTDRALRESRQDSFRGADCDGHRRTRPLSRSATPVPSPACGSTSKTGIGEEAGTQFVPGTRAYSAHNRLHANAPAPCRFAQSYIISGDYVGESPWRRTTSPPRVAMVTG